MRLTNNEMQVMQYNYTPKPDMFMQLGDAFTWSVPVIGKALGEMLIGFFEHTNDAVFSETGQNKEGSGGKSELAVLEDDVLDALHLRRKDGGVSSGRSGENREEFCGKAY